MTSVKLIATVKPVTIQLTKDFCLKQRIPPEIHKLIRWEAGKQDTKAVSRKETDIALYPSVTLVMDKPLEVSPEFLKIPQVSAALSARLLKKIK